MLTAILTVVLFCVMIIPHEFGHFITAKACGVQVNEFSMGMGPLLWQRQKGETLYSLRLIPIGGYCAMEGENEESDNPRAFNNKKAWQKLAVLLAGALMNILIALLVMIITVTSLGMATNTIGEVTDSGPAAAAGIRAGDRILSVNGHNISDWSELAAEISSVQAGDSVNVIVMREGTELPFDVVTAEAEDGRPVIGIQTKLSHNPFKGVKYGAIATWDMNRVLIDSFKQLITGKVGADEISGPVGIVSLVGQTTQYGWTSFLYLVALISLNLAIINLLPFPALDGGRILFVLIRKVTGNMITDDIEGRVHALGMVLLLALFVFVTWNDISKLFN